MQKQITAEQNLSWLQDLYANNLESSFVLQDDILDGDILNSNTFLNDHNTPGILKIFTVDNPGWAVKFVHNDTLYHNNPWNNVELSLEIEDNAHWISIKKQQDVFNSASGPLYLNISLEALRCWIEQIPFHIDDLVSARNNLIQNNPLLTWLEEMYYSCCDGDWEHLVGYRIVSIKSGWVAILSIEELELEDKPFDKVLIEEVECNIECYKKDGNFIIRAHHRGLIQGLTIFKEWVEK